ncbi:MAG: S8 family serine peptidase, partial [Planctomycetes bacterium]|nr:S8 family serine peptidase [Planctomycetota bacterium]
MQASGDISDYYRVNLIAGQTITLLVADPTIGDPDLYLWDAAGVNILDFSVNVGTVESLIVPSNGEFLVEAFAFGGASNYVLIIGQTQIAGASGGYRLSDEFVPGEVIMRYSSSVALTAQQSAAQPFMSSLGLQRQGGAPDRAMLLALDGQSNRSAIFRTQDDDLSAVDRMAALASDEQRLKFETLMVIKALNRESSVEYAQPNYITKAMAVPNDEVYPLQWHYPLINLPAAWDITTGDPSVTIAVLDTGVLLNHPDLQGQLIAGYDFVSNVQRAADGDGIDPDPDDPGDSDGLTPSSFHGTHVAGTVAAASNNTIGVAGVAWNAKIMPVRVLGVGGGTVWDIAQGVRYAAGLP